MKYHSFAVVMLLQSASLVSAVHQLRSSKIEKSLDKNIEDFEAQLKTNKHHKHHHVSSLAQQDDDEAPDVAAAEEQASDAIAPKTTTTVAQAEATEENKAEKTDSYPAPDDKDIAKLKSLYDFSRRPQTDNWKDKEHHEYNPWNDPTDYHGYNMRDAKTQMMDVKVISNSRISNNKSGRHCLPFDFFTIQYKGFLQEAGDMVKVLDSRKVNSGRPITFQQGNFHVVKCWDLAGILLHAGEKIRISCPAYLSNGGAESYSHFGSKKIPANSPITYELEILECEKDIADIERLSKKHGSVGLKTFNDESKGNIVGSGTEGFEGNQDYDKNGDIKRSGGGQDKDFKAEIDKEVSKTKPNVDQLNNIVKKEKKAVKAAEDSLENDLKSSEDTKSAQRNIKKEEKVISDSVNVEKKEDKVKKITTKIDEAKKAVDNALTSEEEKKAVDKVKAAKDEVQKEVKKSKTTTKAQQISDNIKEAEQNVNDQKNKVRLLGNTACMQIVSQDRRGNTIALSASQLDLYHPHKTGVYGVFSQSFNNTDRNQMWGYDSVKDVINSLAHHRYVMTMGVKKNLYIYLNLGLKNQKFEIDITGKKIFSEYTKRQLNIFDKPHRNSVEYGKQVKMNLLGEGANVDPRIQTLEWNIKKCDREAFSVFGLTQTTQKADTISKAQLDTVNKQDVTEEFDENEVEEKKKDDEDDGSVNETDDQKEMDVVGDDDAVVQEDEDSLDQNEQEQDDEEDKQEEENDGEEKQEEGEQQEEGQDKEDTEEKAEDKDDDKAEESEQGDDEDEEPSPKKDSLQMLLEEEGQDQSLENEEKKIMSDSLEMGPNHNFVATETKLMSADSFDRYK